MIDIELLKSKVGAILRSPNLDLARTTESSIRKQIELEMGVSLTDYKEIINVRILKNAESRLLEGETPHA